MVRHAQFIFIINASTDKDTAEEFLAKLENGEIEEWDHRVLLRYYWLT